MKDVNQKSEQPATYQIKVQGELTEEWSDWFNGMTITVEGGSNTPLITTLAGVIVDQAALRGLLNKIWDLGLTLIYLNRVEMNAEGEKSNDRQD